MRFKTLSLIALTALIFSACNTPATDEHADEPAGQPLVYENADFNFSITLPSTWEGYTVNPNSDSWHFDMPKQDSIFAIYLYLKADWDTLEEPKPQYLGENTNFVFAGVPAEDVSKAAEDRLAEVPSILETFEITQ